MQSDASLARQGWAATSQDVPLGFGPFSAFLVFFRPPTSNQRFVSNGTATCADHLRSADLAFTAHWKPRQTKQTKGTVKPGCSSVELRL